MLGLEGEGSNTTSSSRPFSTNGSNGSGASPLHKAALSNSTNGTRRASQAKNGSTHGNGGLHHKSPFEQIPKSTYFGHDREEVTRIIIQSLTDMGYEKAAEILTLESRYELESPAVSAFRNAVLRGEWAEAEDLLFGSSRPPEEGGVSINGNGLLPADGADRNDMRFRLRQQKFLEFLEERDTGRALMVLRMELSPLNHDSGRLHFLSGLLMCQSTDDLKEKAEWDGAKGESRHQLLSDLSRRISPSKMIPEHRLAVLLQEVKQNQIANCIYHNTAASPSLYSDHKCERENFPVKTALELSNHNGDVWQVKFSHDGRSIASCGSDGYTFVYDVDSWSLKWKLPAVDIDPAYNRGICSLAWSPDDSRIVTCGQDKKAKIWNTANGQCIKVITRFQEPVSSCAWAPDGRSFVTGCLDKERNLVQWTETGEFVYDWGRSHRVADVAISPDGNRLVAMDDRNHIHVYNFMTREPEYKLDLKIKLSSVTISGDSRFLLVNRTDGEAQLWDLERRDMLRRFVGSKGGEFVIRSSFAGANETFIASGSEDGCVLIWHKENGRLVEKLLGHRKGCCSTISWNPTDPSMFASAGDDGVVRIWSNSASTIHDASTSGRRKTESRTQSSSASSSGTSIAAAAAAAAAFASTANGQRADRGGSTSSNTYNYSLDELQGRTTEDLREIAASDQNRRLAAAARARAGGNGGGGGGGNQ